MNIVEKELISEGLNVRREGIEKWAGWRLLPLLLLWQILLCLGEASETQTGKKYLYITGN